MHFITLQNSDLKQLWERNLKQNLKNSDIVCEFHFQRDEVVRFDVIKIGQDIIVYHLKKYRLTLNALPIKAEDQSLREVNFSKNRNSCFWNV